MCIAELKMFLCLSFQTLLVLLREIHGEVLAAHVLMLTINKFCLLLFYFLADEILQLH